MKAKFHWQLPLVHSRNTFRAVHESVQGLSTVDPTPEFKADFRNKEGIAKAKIPTTEAPRCDQETGVENMLTSQHDKTLQRRARLQQLRGGQGRQHRDKSKQQEQEKQHVHGSSGGYPGDLGGENTSADHKGGELASADESLSACGRGSWAGGSGKGDGGVGEGGDPGLSSAALASNNGTPYTTRNPGSSDAITGGDRSMDHTENEISLDGDMTEGATPGKVAIAPDHSWKESTAEATAGRNEGADAQDDTGRGRKTGDGQVDPDIVSPDCSPHGNAMTSIASIPRIDVLRELRKRGPLRTSAMKSDALRPVLTDKTFTQVCFTN